MKRLLLVVAAALMFLTTVVVPTVAHADGMPSCSGACKP
jgi:hypothetical protein